MQPFIEMRRSMRQTLLQTFWEVMLHSGGMYALTAKKKKLKVLHGMRRVY